MTLRPTEIIQQVLLSTTSRFVGEFENDCMLVTHAWPDFEDRSASERRKEGPASRNAFVFVFRTQEIPKVPGVVIPNYAYLGDVICAYMAVLFGKRFDSHGLMQGSGMFHVPNLTAFNHFCRHDLPHNSHQPRPDFAIPLHLAEFARIEPIFLDRHGLDEKFRTTFRTCAQFYLQALRNVESNPEVAYLHFITAGEILSNLYDYSREELLDDQIKRTLATIEAQLDDGVSIADALASRLRQVKRRFVKTLETLIDDDFFNRSEASEAYLAFNRNDFLQRMGAAYDLRSRYVHTGIPFGAWVSRAGFMNNEIFVGQPGGLDDKELCKIISRAPTLVGLERVIRYALLRAAQLLGVPISTPSNPSVNPST